jgi:hypothetical protein
MTADQSRWGMETHPTVLGFGGILLLAIIALAVLRFFYGSIRIEASAGTS